MINLVPLILHVFNAHAIYPQNNKSQRKRKKFDRSNFLEVREWIHAKL